MRRVGLRRRRRQGDGGVALAHGGDLGVCALQRHGGVGELPRLPRLVVFGEERDSGFQARGDPACAGEVGARPHSVGCQVGLGVHARLLVVEPESVGGMEGMEAGDDAGALRRRHVPHVENARVEPRDLGRVRGDGLADVERGQPGCGQPPRSRLGRPLLRLDSDVASHGELTAVAVQQVEAEPLGVRRGGRLVRNHMGGVVVGQEGRAGEIGSRDTELRLVEAGLVAALLRFTLAVDEREVDDAQPSSEPAAGAEQHPRALWVGSDAALSSGDVELDLASCLVPAPDSVRHARVGELGGGRRPLVPTPRRAHSQ